MHAYTPLVTCCWAAAKLFFFCFVARGTSHRTAYVRAYFYLRKGLFMPISAYFRAYLASLRHVTRHRRFKGL